MAWAPRPTQLQRSWCSRTPSTGTGTSSWCWTSSCRVRMRVQPYTGQQPSKMGMRGAMLGCVNSLCGRSRRRHLAFVPRCKAANSAALCMHWRSTPMLTSGILHVIGLRCHQHGHRMLAVLYRIRATSSSLLSCEAAFGVIQGGCRGARRHQRARRRCLCTSRTLTCFGPTSSRRRASGRAPSPPASSCCTERHGVFPGNNARHSAGRTCICASRVWLR
jgi:hypothetical protein